MKKLFWSDHAVADLDAIINYIAQDSPAAAVRLGDDIESRVATLGSYPQSGRIGRMPGTRELVVAHSPYVVIYTAGEDVRILRVLHAARRWPPFEER